jgi:hypothetical protein
VALFTVCTFAQVQRPKNSEGLGAISIRPSKDFRNAGIKSIDESSQSDSGRF